MTIEKEIRTIWPAYATIRGDGETRWGDPQGTVVLDVSGAPDGLRRGQKVMLEYGFGEEASRGPWTVVSVGGANGCYRLICPAWLW